MNYKKRKTPHYFLYRENPFRPLYMDAVGFRTPPTRLEQSISPRAYHLWVFVSRATARAMCHANNHPGNGCSYAEVSEFYKLLQGRIPRPVEKPTTAMKRPKGPGANTNLEDLA